MSTETMQQDPMAAATIHFVSSMQEINLKPTEKLSPRWLAWVMLVGATESTGGERSSTASPSTGLALRSTAWSGQMRLMVQQCL